MVDYSYRQAFLESLGQLKQASLIPSLCGKDTTRVSMKTICLVFAMQHPNNKELTLPWRQDHFSKCPVIENSRFIERVAAVGVNDVNLTNVHLWGILKSILILTSSLRRMKDTVFLHFNQACISCNNILSLLQLHILVSFNNRVLLLYPFEESEKTIC